MSKVAITGASGFIGSHCVKEFVKAGYSVRAVVRPTTHADFFQETLGLKENTVEMTYADLLDEGVWSEALWGCDFVVHVASPLPDPAQTNGEFVVKQAVEGTKNVMEAARDQGLKKVVLTSSLGAVCGSEKVGSSRVYGVNDWTDPNLETVSSYNKSKTLAEREARRIAKESDELDLVTVNPGITIGPSTSGHISQSNKVLFRLLENQFSVLPPVSYEYVDVRDVAKLHRLALEYGQADDRILCSTEFLSFEELQHLVIERAIDFGVDVSKTRVLQAGTAVPSELVEYKLDFDVRRPIDRRETWQRFSLTPLSISQSIFDTFGSFHSHRKAQEVTT